MERTDTGFICTQRQHVIGGRRVHLEQLDAGGSNMKIAGNVAASGHGYLGVAEDGELGLSLDDCDLEDLLTEQV